MNQVQKLYLAQVNRKLYDSYVFPFRRTDSEDKLEEDYELQAWALELVADGNPGCGIKVGKKKINID